MTFIITNWVQENDMFFATITDENDCMVDTLHQLDGETWLRSGREFLMHSKLQNIIFIYS